MRYYLCIGHRRYEQNIRGSYFKAVYSGNDKKVCDEWGCNIYISLHFRKLSLIIQLLSLLRTNLRSFSWGTTMLTFTEPLLFYHSLQKRFVPRLPVFLLFSFLFFFLASKHQFESLVNGFFCLNFLGAFDMTPTRW